MEGRKAWAGATTATAVLAVSMYILLVISSLEAEAAVKTEQVLHSQVYHSSVFELASGDVIDRYELMEFPTGHIAMRSFDVELVDESGAPVPLSEVYLHHWLALKYFVKKGYKELLSPVPKKLTNSNEKFRGHFEFSHRHKERMAFHEEADPEQVKNHGTCNDDSLDALFLGLGSETRHTDSSLPAPYGIVAGDPDSFPEGKEEAWYLNIHAISLNGVVDAKSCDECLCKAYGITEDSLGRPLSDGYLGGLHCCYDQTKCPSKDPSDTVKRKFFMKYTITWVDWDSSAIPLRAYAIDVTDDRTSLAQEPNCKTEYTVEACAEGVPNSQCIHHRHTVAALPEGGDLIYASLHQHNGALGGVLYEKDGRVICASEPIYGKGTAAGDEAGFVVGMTTCHPEPGSMYIEPWKELHFDSYYSSEGGHTGVMSIFFLRVADPVNLIAEVTDSTE